jgi:hypothetical protein
MMASKADMAKLHADASHSGICFSSPNASIATYATQLPTGMRQCPCIQHLARNPKTPQLQLVQSQPPELHALHDLADADRRHRKTTNLCSRHFDGTSRVKAVRCAILRGARHCIQRCSVQRRFRRFTKHSSPALVDCVLDPICNLLVYNIVAGLGRALVSSGHTAFCCLCLCNLVFVFLCDGLWFYHRRKPRVTEEHSVCWSQLRDLVQTPAHKVLCSFAVAFLWKIRRLAVHNCL